MKNRNKWHRQRSTNLLIGFIVSISLCLMAFNYTIYENPHVDLGQAPELFDETIDVIPTAFPKPKKKVIPPPTVIDPQDEIDPVDEVEIKEPDLIEPTIEMTSEVSEKTTVINNPIASPTPTPPAVLPPKKEPKVNEIFRIVQHMAYFGSCNESEITKEAKKACSDLAFYTFLRDQIKYPKIAKENGIEGIVILEIILGVDGNVESAKVVRDIGGGCGKEALRVINKMPSWSPAKQRGETVRLRMTLPVKFVLG